MLLETAFCFSLLTMLLVVDKTGGVVSVVNKINNLGGVGVRGCVGGVAKLLFLLCLRCQECVRGSIFPDLCSCVYTNNATTPSGPGPPQLRWLRRLDVVVVVTMPAAEPVTGA